MARTNRSPLSLAVLGAMSLALLAGGPIGVCPAQQSGGQPSKERRPEARVTEVDLRPRFKLGQVIKFDLDLSDKELPKPAAIAPGGRPAPRPEPAPKPTGAKPGGPSGTPNPEAAAFRQQVGISLKVDSLDAEGNAALTLTLESLKMSGDGPAGKIEFDSTKPVNAQDPMDALFRSITTMTMRVEVDHDGEVKSITPNGSGGGVGALVAGNVTGGDFVRSLVGPIFSPRPGRTSARVGESWSEESQMKASAGDWTLVTTKTLRSYSGGKATIDIKGQVKIQPGSLGAAPTGNPKTDMVQQGQAVWNAEQGMLDRLDMKMLSEVGLLGSIGDLGGLGDLTGGAGGIDGENGASSTPSRHETTFKVQRRR